MTSAHAVAAFVARVGGYIVAPRAQVASLGPDDAARDGLWLSSLYVASTSLYGLAEAVAATLALRSLGALVMLLSAVAVALIAPIVTLVAAEAVLGRDRSYRRAVALVPLLALALAEHGLGLLDTRFSGPNWTAPAVGCVCGLALAWWVRATVTPLEAPP